MKPKTAVAVEEPPKNSFLRTLAELRNGVALTEASDGLAQVVKEARRVGKTGELTLKIKVTPDDGESMSIRCDVTTKIPRKDTRVTSFFDTEDGSLLRDNPSQAEMFSITEGGKTEAEDVAPPVQQAVNG